jgi:quinol-cytochrome oxidoreductase complex cytochrome b subunit
MTTSDETPHPGSSFFHRIRKSIFPGPPFSPSGARPKRYLLRNLPLHFRPTTVAEPALRFSLTWALGGAALVLVLLQLGTGVLLKFAYDPTPAGAYSSVQALLREVSFGPLMRNLHYWCANLLVAVVFLHMLRVFYTGAFHAPRQLNWILGWGLFLLLLASNFTGYLLPFDQFAYWAVTVSTGMLAYVPVAGSWLQEVMRGGPEIGPATLRLFFALHTALLPAAITALAAYHFWRIRKAGGLVVAKPSGENPDIPRVSVMPHLLVREAAAALVVTAAVVVLSIFFDAPLGEPANPGLSPNPTKAPWYFAGFQELLLHLHPSAAVFWFPLAGALLVAAMPYLTYPRNPAGVWFVSDRGRRLAAIFAGVGFFAAGMAVFGREALARSASGSSGIDGLLSAAVPAVFAGVYGGLRKHGADKNEAVQTLFTMAVAAFIALTVVGVFFRGTGMQLVFP